MECGIMKTRLLKMNRVSEIKSVRSRSISYSTNKRGKLSGELALRVVCEIDNLKSPQRKFIDATLSLSLSVSDERKRFLDAPINKDKEHSLIVKDSINTTKSVIETIVKGNEKKITMLTQSIEKQNVRMKKMMENIQKLIQNE